MKKLQFIFTVLICVAIAQSIYYFPRLPEVMASHFDGLGDPNGWSTKAVFFGIYAGMLVLSIVIFMVIPNKFLHRSKLSLNLPNKEYWLAPKRTDQTVAFIRSHMMYFGIVNVLLAIYVVQLVILANFNDQPRLNSTIVWALLIYFAYVAIWLIRFFIRFRRESA